MEDQKRAAPRTRAVKPRGDQAAAGATAAASATTATRKSPAPKPRAARPTSAAAAPPATTTAKTTGAPVAPAKKNATTPAQVAPAKRTPARKAAPAAQPDQAAVPSPARVPVPLAPLWPSLRANPGYAPELLALTAVSRLGPVARDQLAWLRDRYPTATADGLARLAIQRCLRQSRTRGAMAGLGGPVAVVAGVTALTWSRATLVLHLAAAYGLDPTEPQRAAELLVLLGVHPNPATATDAVRRAGAAAQRGAAEPGGDVGRLRARLGVLATGATRLAATHRIARLWPGASVLAGGLAGAGSTELLAARATQLYRDAERRSA